MSKGSGTHIIGPCGWAGETPGGVDGQQASEPPEGDPLELSAGFALPQDMPAVSFGIRLIVARRFIMALRLSAIRVAVNSIF